MAEGSPQILLETPLELPCGLRQDTQATRCSRCGARRIGVCGALDDEELNELNRLAVALRAEGDQTIFYEGDPATNAFNITEGTVRLTRLLADGRRTGPSVFLLGLWPRYWGGHRL